MSNKLTDEYNEFMLEADPEDFKVAYLKLLRQYADLETKFIAQIRLIEKLNKAYEMAVILTLDIHNKVNDKQITLDK